MSVLSICRSVRKITDAELDELEQMAKEQYGYFSPLKLATQARQRALGTHNQLVLELLRRLRDAIKEGEFLA